MSERVTAFLKMLERGQDSALLRFSLGNEFLAAGEPAEAVKHLRQAVELDRRYSAAWKLLGKALTEAGDESAARQAFASGVDIANEAGDRQAAKEMAVFLKRLDKARNGGTA